MSIRKRRLKKPVVFIFDMPRMPPNLREHAMGMLNAGMTVNAVAMSIGCSTRAIRHLRQRFQATGRTEDRSRSGRQRITMRGQDRYIRSIHQDNRSQTATATAANTRGTHSNRISAETVRSRLREGGLLGHVVDMLLVLCYGATSPRKSF